MPVPPPAELKIPYAAPVSRRDLACSRLPRGAVTEKGGGHEDAAGRAASDNHGQPGPAASQPSAPLLTRPPCVAGVALPLFRFSLPSGSLSSGSLLSRPRQPGKIRARQDTLARRRHAITYAGPPERSGSTATSGRKGGRMEYQKRAAGRPDQHAGRAGSAVVPHCGSGRTGRPLLHWCRG